MQREFSWMRTFRKWCCDRQWSRFLLIGLQDWTSMCNTFEHVEANAWSCLVSILALSMRVLSWQKPLQYHRIIGYHWDPVRRFHDRESPRIAFRTPWWIPQWGSRAFWRLDLLSSRVVWGHVYPADWWMQNRWISAVKAIEAVQQRT